MKSKLIKEKSIESNNRLLNALSRTSIMIGNLLFVDIKFSEVRDRFYVDLSSESKLDDISTYLEQIIKGTLKLISSTDGSEKIFVESDLYIHSINSGTKMRPRGCTNLPGYCKYQIKKGKYIGKYCNTFLLSFEENLCTKHSQ